jgi:hypothetical protein
MNKVMKYTAIVAALVLLGTATRSYGMAENWAAQVDTFLTLQGGLTGDPQGSLMKIGVLSTSIANMQANQNNIAFLDANFNAWQTGTVGTGSPINGTFSIVSSGVGGSFLGQQIYLLAYNAATPGAATQVGLYTNPSWVFPVSDSAGANSMELTQLSNNPSQILIGAYSAGTITSPTDIAGGNAVQLHLVPEPSSIALVGLGLLGLIGFARRRS